MANYLAVLRHVSRTEEGRILRDALGPGSEDSVVVPLHGGWELTWIAQQARGDLLPEHGLFSGFAVDDADSRIVYGAPGIVRTGGQRLGTDLPGCYVHLDWSPEHAELSADLYRSMPVSVTSGPGLTLISDSPYILLQLRRSLGLPVTLDTAVAESLLWRNSMSGQLLGSRTPAREISYVPVGGRLRLDLGSASSVVQRSGPQVPALFSPPTADYATELRTAAQRIASLIHTIAASGPEHARLALSGGKDSRICLAAALLSPQARESARFSCTNTAEQHRRDYEVVSDLSREFGFPLGPRQPDDDRGAELRRIANPLAVWFSDSSMTYFPVKLQAYSLRAKGPFAIAGFGSELYKGNYGLRPVAAIEANIARAQPRIAASFLELTEEVLRSSGIDPADPLSAEWHYLLLRNALHGGRFVPVTKFGLRPLQQRNLVGLSKMPPDGVLWSSPRQIPDDLLALLSPSLASRPFDRPAKDRSAADVVARLRQLGGPLSSSEITTYAISGSPTDVHDGPVKTLLNLVDQSRIAGRLSRENVAPHVDSAAEAVAAAGVSADWTALAREQQTAIRDRSIPVGHTHGMPGRLLAVAEVLRAS
ncbi:hypothetical protein AB0271_11350 [Kocuria palustris]|uniref:hypothetical protein n=1 Tax=Kocuria palustris TaxID=71999 RepID=UPI00344BEB1C